MNNRFLRNKDLIDQRQLDKITVVGAGGIGSAIIQLLTIMGFKEITIYDSDVMEEHNRSTTIYPQYSSEYSPTKVSCANNLAISYNSDIIFNQHPINYNPELDNTLPVTPKMIVCLDNMEDRLAIYEHWRLNNKDSNGYFIDGRMDALAFEIVTMQMKDDPSEYYEHWTPSADIEDAPCTMKHTIFTASIVAGMMVNQLFALCGNRGYYQYVWMNLLTNNLRKEGFRINSIAKIGNNQYITNTLTEEK